MVLNWLYHVLRQRIPFYVFLMYAFTKNRKSPVFEDLTNAVFTLILGIAIFLSCGLVSGIKFSDYIDLSWSYHGALGWCFLNVSVYLYLRARNLNGLYALNLMAHMTNAGGWIYELPYFLFASEGRLFSLNYIFFINLQILSILFLIGALNDRNFKLNNFIKFTIGIYLLYSCLTIFDNSVFIRFTWFQRVPTIFMLFSLATGLES